MMARAYQCMSMSLWLGVIALVAGCGLGTEVGNGFKPGKDSEDSGNKKSDAQAGAPEETDDNVADGDVGGSDGDEAVDPVVSASVDDLNGSVPKSVLFATCGSPFSENLEVPFDLILKDSDILVWHVAAGDGTVVTLRGEAEEDVWDIDRAAPEALDIKDENGDAFADTYKCQDAVDRKVTKQEDDTFVETATVTMDAGDTHYTVSWSVSYATETAPRRLQTISIQGADEGTSAALEARY